MIQQEQKGAGNVKEGKRERILHLTQWKELQRPQWKSQKSEENRDWPEGYVWSCVQSCIGRSKSGRTELLCWREWR